MTTAHQQALDFICNDQWDQAHQLIQQHKDTLACQIHGYLHRLEGDLSNAAYWYDRAGVTYPKNSSDAELQRLIKLSTG
jgi:hypothetical protein